METSEFVGKIGLLLVLLLYLLLLLITGALRLLLVASSGALTIQINALLQSLKALVVRIQNCLQILLFHLKVELLSVVGR